MYEYYYPDYLMHYGVKGMKWGVRRYQNPDGSLTRAGKKRQDKIQKEAFNELKKYDAKGIDRGEAVNSKSKHLVDAINDGKRYLDKVLNTNDALSKAYDIEYKKAYDKLAKDYEKQYGRKLDRYSDAHDEAYELASAKAYKSKSVTKIRDEGDRLMRDYKNYVDKAADNTFGKHKDTVVRERGGRKITAKQALDDVIRSATSDDRRNKWLDERGLSK